MGKLDPDTLWHLLHRRPMLVLAVLSVTGALVVRANDPSRYQRGIKMAQAV